MMSKNEYQELTLTLNYNEAGARKIQKKKDGQLSKKEQFQIKLNPLDNHISILDCAIDYHHLIREAENWKNRTSRTVDRVNKTLRERAELLTLHDSLNERWKKLTNDSQDLCEPLTLKADSKIYFL